MYIYICIYIFSCKITVLCTEAYAECILNTSFLFTSYLMANLSIIINAWSIFYFIFLEIMGYKYFPI